MQYYELDKNEQALLDSFDKDELKSIKGIKKAILSYTAVAKSTLGRTKNINIRLSEKDLQKLKSKASEKGIPYQTLVASVLHQYGTK